jgi:NADPH:quinone reductase-like Zn-dependent oxidoreductase
LLPNGKRIKGYGTHRGEIEPFKEDWGELFTLLEEGKIKPVIAEKFPLLEARKANELLEGGQVTGNIVLLAPELI